MTTVNDLLDYFRKGDPDPDVVRGMGYSTIADMIPSFDSSDKQLLIDLIVLSQRPDEHKDIADTAAGKKIFKRCCTDPGLQSEVDKYYADNGIQDYSIGTDVDSSAKAGVDCHIKMVKDMMDGAIKDGAIKE